MQTVKVYYSKILLFRKRFSPLLSDSSKLVLSKNKKAYSGKLDYNINTLNP